MRRAAAALLLVAATPAGAQTICAGETWRLALDGDAAVLDFVRRTEMEIPHTSIAETAVGGWPRAMTLIGARDTAILIVEREPCMAAGRAHPAEAHLLTQRGTTPIYLTGCCDTLPD